MSRQDELPIRKGEDKMLKKINAVSVLGGISFLALIAAAGFLEGGSTLGAVISLIVFAVGACIASRENGTKK